MKHLILATLPLLLLVTVTYGVGHPQRGVLTLRRSPRCIPRKVYRATACLCFLSFQKHVITPSLRTACKGLFSRAARNLGSRCREFERMGRIRPFDAITAGRHIKGSCFREGGMLNIPPGADKPGALGGAPLQEILEGLHEIRDVLEQALEALDVTFALPSAPARRVVVGDVNEAKTLRLVAYNGINPRRE